MPPLKLADMKPRRVTISGAVPYDAVPLIERAAHARKQTLSAFVADAVIDAATKQNRKTDRAA